MWTRDLDEAVCTTSDDLETASRRDGLTAGDCVECDGMETEEQRERKRAGRGKVKEQAVIDGQSLE